jgi:aldehyde dehydrogenase (NAD+)
VIEHNKLFIGTQWVEPSGSGMLEVVSPSTEEVVGRVPEVTKADIDRAVDAARTAFDEGPWPHTDPAERLAVLQKFTELYMNRVPEIGELITTQMGTPISSSVAIQTSPCLMVLQAFLQIGAQFPWEERRTGGIFPQGILVRREPMGVAAAIVPFNIPQFGVISKLAPALLAGCAMVVKPAPESPLDSYVMAEMLAEAGVPEGVVSILPAGREVSEYLVAHPGIDKVAFTGSTAAGRRIAAVCGEQLKRVSLELGGKSAAIVLEDADLPTVVPGLKFATLISSGEACIQQSRILAPRSRYDEVVDALADAVKGTSVGDPADPSVIVGPLVAERQRDRVLGYIDKGTAEGAKLAVGGGRPKDLDKGWFVEPTLFVDVDNSMTIAQEEIFGPVLAVIPYGDETEAVAIANDSDFGLSGSVWTTDVERGIGVARQVRTGTYGVNSMATIDIHQPFGGFKASGVGREFGPEGLSAFLETKTIILPGDYQPPS